LCSSHGFNRNELNKKFMNIICIFKKKFVEIISDFRIGRVWVHCNLLSEDQSSVKSSDGRGRQTERCVTVKCRKCDGYVDVVYTGHAEQHVTLF